jgi:hypothetical protein
MSDFRLLTFRRVLTFAINGGSALALVTSWAWLPLLEFTYIDIRSTLSTSVAVTATVGGLFASVYFLTAQVGSNGLRGYGLSELYRAPELFLLLGSLVGALIAGTAALALPVDFEALFATMAFAAISLGLYVILIVLPVGLIQVENLNYRLVALKLVRQITTRGIVAWGLSDVRKEAGRFSATLLHQGIDYRRKDPLRPIHDLVETAASQRDTHLIGRIVELLCERIAFSLGARSSGVPLYSRLDELEVRAFRALTPTCSITRSTMVAVHILHYLRRLAVNVGRSWERWDSGRHSTHHALSRLVATLAAHDRDGVVIRMCLFVILHISLDYRAIAPYGRVEPLTALFVSANVLVRRERRAEAILAAEVLGVISARTEQVSFSRVGDFRSLLDPELHQYYVNAAQVAVDDDWLPEPRSDDLWPSLAIPDTLRLTVREQLTALGAGAIAGLRRLVRL